MVRAENGFGLGLRAEEIMYPSFKDFLPATFPALPIPRVLNRSITQPILGEVTALEDCALVRLYPNDNHNKLGLGMGIFPKYGHWIRSVLKFDLSPLEDITVPFMSAKLFLYGRTMYEPATVEAWFSDDDTWKETNVTWANQPKMVDKMGSTTDIPSEESWFPVNLDAGTIRDELQKDKLLSLVLKGDEESTENTYCYAFERESKNPPRIEVYLLPAFPF